MGGFTLSFGFNNYLQANYPRDLYQQILLVKSRLTLPIALDNCGNITHQHFKLNVSKMQLNIFLSKLVHLTIFLISQLAALLLLNHTN